MPDIQKTNIPAQQFVTPTSRYINSEVINYGERKILTFKTYKGQNLEQNKNDKFYTITASLEYRPDLLSYKVYGIVDYWWKIMEFNNIKDIYDFKSGMTIRLPSNIYT